jgi:microcystin-dependent protein
MFIVGAGSAYPLMDTGGSNTVTLIPSEVPLRSHTHDNGTLVADSAGSHYHTYNTSNSGGGSTGRADSGGADNDNAPGTNSAGAHSHSISGNTGTPNVPEVPGAPHENRPPYYALTYIIKT